MMISGGGGAPGMGIRMPMAAMRTQMPPGRVIPGPGEGRERERTD